MILLDSRISTAELRKYEPIRSCIFILIFLYFFTTSADLLQIEISLFHAKVNHLLALFLFFIFSMHQKKWLLPEKKLAVAFLGTVFVMLISGLMGTYPYRSCTYVGVYIFTFCVYFLLPFSFFVSYGHKKIFTLYWAAFLSTGLFALLQFIVSLVGITAPFVTQFVAHTFARGQAMTYEPSYYALFMVPYVMYFNARFLFDCKTVFSPSKLGALFGKNILLLVSTSTGAFFAYFIFFFVVLAASRLQWVKLCGRKLVRKVFEICTLFAAFFLGIFLIAPKLFKESFWKFFAVGFMSHGSFQERWEGIVGAWDVFLENPFFGVGIGGVGPLIYQNLFFNGDVSLSIHEPYAKMFDYFDPTNVFSELLGSIGCIGLVAFVWLGYSYLRYMHTIMKKQELSNEEKSISFGLLVSVLVMLIVLQFNQNLFRSYIWVHLGICLGYVYSLKVKYER